MREVRIDEGWKDRGLKAEKKRIKPFRKKKQDV